MSFIPIPAEEFKDPQEFGRLVNERFRSLDQSLSSATRATSTTAVSSSTARTTGYSGTHAQRLATPASGVVEGAVWWETDRDVLYLATGGGSRAWRYSSGEMSGTIYSPDQKPADLGTEDVGFLFRSTDFARVFRWSGSAWVRGDGEPVTLAIEESPIAIAATGWKAMDGTGNPVRYSLDDGTTATITLPDATDLYLAQNTWTGTAVAAVAPGLTGSLATESTHTHGVTTTDHTHGVTTSNHTHAIDHDHPSADTGPPTVGGTVTWNVGATPSQSAASTGHIHPFDMPAYTGTSGSGGGETVTSVSDGGETVTSAAGSAHTHGLGTLAASAAGRPPTLKVYRAVKL